MVTTQFKGDGRTVKSAGKMTTLASSPSNPAPFSGTRLVDRINRSLTYLAEVKRFLRKLCVDENIETSVRFQAAAIVDECLAVVEKLLTEGEDDEDEGEEKSWEDRPKDTDPDEAVPHEEGDHENKDDDEDMEDNDVDDEDNNSQEAEGICEREFGPSLELTETTTEAANTSEDRASSTVTTPDSNEGPLNQTIDSQQSDSPCESVGDGHQHQQKQQQQQQLRIRTISNAVKPYSCSYCSQSFTQSKYLQQHIACRHEGAVNECPVCKKHFSSINNLNIHAATHKEKRDEFSCQLCDKVYLYKSHLNKHHRAEHLNLRYQCPLCKKTMKTRSNLAQHIRLHEGVTYNCEHCEATFSQKSGLLYHKKSKHADASTQKFRCDVCSREFVLKSKLNDHLKRCHEGQDEVSGGQAVSVASKVFANGFRTRVSSQAHMRRFDVTKRRNASALLEAQQQQQQLQQQQQMRQKLQQQRRQKTFLVFKSKNSASTEPSENKDGSSLEGSHLQATTSTTSLNTTHPSINLLAVGPTSVTTPSAAPSSITTPLTVPSYVSLQSTSFIFPTITTSANSLPASTFPPTLMSLPASSLTSLPTAVISALPSLVPSSSPTTTSSSSSLISFSTTSLAPSGASFLQPLAPLSSFSTLTPLPSSCLTNMPSSGSVARHPSSSIALLPSSLVPSLPSSSLTVLPSSTSSTFPSISSSNCLVSSSSPSPSQPHVPPLPLPPSVPPPDFPLISPTRLISDENPQPDDDDALNLDPNGVLSLSSFDADATNDAGVSDRGAVISLSSLGNEDDDEDENDDEDDDDEDDDTESENASVLSSAHLTPLESIYMGHD